MKILSNKKKNKREKKMGMVDEWSEMNLKKKEEEIDEICVKRGKTKWKLEDFGWKWMKIEKKYEVRSEVGHGGLEWENGDDDSECREEDEVVRESRGALWSKI